MSSEPGSDSARAKQAADGPWTIGRVLAWSTGFLQDKGLSDSPRLDAEVLLAHALKMTRIQLYTEFDKPLSQAEREPFKATLKRRGSGEPVAYITGEKEFMGLRFQVDSAVLIPRPDTELLVETALAWLEARALPSPRLLDIGTGSGCIALSLAAKIPQAEVEAWDIDAAALTVARANQTSLSARFAHLTKLHFSEVDALDPAAWSDSPAGYDLIVANPPYISPAEAAELPASVRDYEPQGALFAAPDGLAFYRALALRAGRALRPDGCLMVEIGSTQAAAVSALLRAAGWQNLACHKDLGRHDRVLVASKPAAAQQEVGLD